VNQASAKAKLQIRPLVLVDSSIDRSILAPYAQFNLADSGYKSNAQLVLILVIVYYRGLYF
jgi:hypothetical protein